MRPGLGRGREEWCNLPVFAHLQASSPAAPSSLKARWGLESATLQVALRVG